MFLCHFLADIVLCSGISDILVGASKYTQNFEIHYANLCIFKSNKNHFSISFDSLCFTDRAWWGLPNFYTELCIH